VTSRRGPFSIVAVTQLILTQEEAALAEARASKTSSRCSWEVVASEEEEQGLKGTLEALNVEVGSQALILEGNSSILTSTCEDEEKVSALVCEDCYVIITF